MVVADAPKTSRSGFPVRYADVAAAAELLSGMLYLWERLKIVVEPTGALGAAGLFERGFPVAGKRVGVVLSGGNVDFAAVMPLL